MRAVLAILAIGSAHALSLKKQTASTLTCEPVKPSDDAKFDSVRPGNPKNIADKFSISVCRKSDLEGEFRITKLHNCEKKAVKFATTEGLEADVTQRMGQDEFVFSLEGPEVRALHTTASANNANCEYVLPYKLSIPGNYHLNLVWTRENYLGVKETSKTWPQGHLDLPLGTGTFLKFGSAEPADILKNLKAARTGPTCNYKDSSSRSGRWVHKGETDESIQKMFSKRRARCADKSLNEDSLSEDVCQTWIHTQVDYTNYEWIPDNCQPRRFTKEEARQCLAKSSLLLRGDSHLRHLFGAMADYACDMPMVIKGQGAYHSTCVSSQDAKMNACRHLPRNTLCFRQDYFGVGQPMPQLDHFNLTVVNFGQHQADGSHQQSVGQFKKGVAMYSKELEKQLSTRKGKFAWHETNALPYRMDHYVKNFKDWRTYQRLQLYNEVTTPNFEKLGAPIIPSYESTLDFSLHTTNNAHYPKEVLMPQVQNILGLLCE